MVLFVELLDCAGVGIGVGNAVGEPVSDLGVRDVRDVVVAVEALTCILHNRKALKRLIHR